VERRQENPKKGDDNRDSKDNWEESAGRFPLNHSLRLWKSRAENSHLMVQSDGVPHRHD
jgi:hypothetical protein